MRRALCVITLAIILVATAAAPALAAYTETKSVSGTLQGVAVSGYARARCTSHTDTDGYTSTTTGSYVYYVYVKCTLYSKYSNLIPGVIHSYTNSSSKGAYNSRGCSAAVFHTSPYTFDNGSSCYVKGTHAIRRYSTSTTSYIYSTTGTAFYN